MTERIAVLGAGVMGTGIATLAVGHGFAVTLVDVDDGVLAKAEQAIAKQLKLAKLMGKLPREQAAGELTTTTSIEDIKPASTIIESITEKPELKVKVIAEATAAAPDAILATNTSAIPVDELASAAQRPEQVLGIHFMNPPYLIKAVEVIRGPRSSERAMTAATDLLTRLGKDTVVVNDGPGFVINRILQRMINEAARIVEEDRATPEAVDALFTGCLGHTTGPLATADLIGLDNVVDSLLVLHERTGDDGYAPCALLLAKVRDGDHGRKTGRGFFEHGG